MAGKIPDDTLQAIRERLSIVEVISGHVSLKKAGRNFLGLCPFHSEKTPSFTVNEERGLFHCFGCGAGGTVFTFVMRAERIGFPEAVELLARRAGVQLPERGERDPAGAERQAFFDVNELAQRHFRQALRAAVGGAARGYLEKRGVQAAVIDQYGLGFCPPNGAGLVRSLTGQRQQRAAELGLIGRRSEGGWYERFRGRVTFPIRDGSGRIVGFGGRTLGSDHPKYLNSPESTVFHKGQVLYGLFEARKAIDAAQRVVIVEGYLDALALVGAEIGYVVASLGTALSVAQLRLARRFAPEVVAFFDGDRAGQEAAARAFAVCVDAGVWGLGAFLPDGVDPDDYVRQHGTEATRRLLQQAVPLADFFLQRIDPGPGASLPERARAAERAGQVICRLRDAFQFNLLARQAAQRLGVDESLFRDMRAAASVSSGTPKPEAPAPQRLAAPVRPEEATLLEAMALDREVASLVAHRGVLKAFSNRALAEAGEVLIEAWNRAQSANAVIDTLPPALADRITAALLGEGPVAVGDRVQTARDCIERIENRARLAEGRAVVTRLREAEAQGDDQRYREALAQKNELLRRKEVRNE
ncbi:MAG: dnaG [Deltaproteobacteria bacterium]|nr:dnaG [Deltaproteobacteria bacterium]